MGYSCLVGAVDSWLLTNDEHLHTSFKQTLDLQDYRDPGSPSFTQGIGSCIYFTMFTKYIYLKYRTYNMYAKIEVAWWFTKNLKTNKTESKSNVLRGMRANLIQM